jgi:DNA-binding NarL/FixJ family response regulator
MTTPITVALVEDNALVRTSVEQVLRDSAACRWVGSSCDAERALESMPVWNPDVVLMDLELPGMSGADCAARLKEVLPHVQILVLTVFSDSAQIFKALKAGASGYLLKRSSPHEVVQAIKDVYSGGAPMSAEIARQVVQSFHLRCTPADPEMQSLTRRENDILELLAGGYASKEIADKLNIGYDTVCGHLGSIYRKLHVRSRTEAVVKYLHSGHRGRAQFVR